VANFDSTVLLKYFFNRFWSGGRNVRQKENFETWIERKKKFKTFVSKNHFFFPFSFFSLKQNKRKFIIIFMYAFFPSLSFPSILVPARLLSTYLPKLTWKPKRRGTNLYVPYESNNYIHMLRGREYGCGSSNPMSDFLSSTCIEGAKYKISESTTGFPNKDS